MHMNSYEISSLNEDIALTCSQQLSSLTGIYCVIDTVPITFGESN